MAKELTIQLDAKGDRLTVESLVAALEKTLALLRTLDPNEEWEVVSVTKKSPFTITVRSPSSDRLAPKYMRGLRMFDKKKFKRAELLFPEPTLEATRDLFSILDNGIEGIKLSYPGQSTVTVTPQVAQNVNRIANDAVETRLEWTSIRGLLYQVTWGEAQQRCRIREALTKTEIPCVIASDLWEQVKDALPHRVDAYGQAKCNRLGVVESMDVVKIRILKDETRTMDQTPAIDVTDGLDAKEHVERLRGAD
jgi:hypothetical protein